MNPFRGIPFAAAAIVAVTACFLFAALPSAHAVSPGCLEGDCKNGVGTYSWPNGDKYTGDFLGGQRTGQGTYLWVNGDKYIGAFRDSKLNGQGTLTWPNGGRYTGEFKDNQMSGQGTRTWPSGHRYAGEFKDGRLSGRGTYSWPDGTTYAGEFREDGRQGRGTLTWADGTVFEGSFDNNVAQPPFELLLPDGTKRPGDITTKTKILNISENSQAQRIGLQRGDIVLEYNKDIILNPGMLVHLSSQTKPIDDVSMVIRRQGKELNLSLKGGRIGIEIEMSYVYSLKDRPQNVAAAVPARPPEAAGAEEAPAVKPGVPDRSAFGKYYALVIGNNNYTSLPKLKTARNDAQTVAGILKNHYGFQVTVLLDAKRADILSTFARFREKLSGRDNLLIYYAGHGFLDKEGDEGYWLPVDATKKDEVNWISNASVTTQLKAIEAKHVLIIADSCYSGKLGRDVHIQRRTPDYYTRIARKRARSVIASGGLEPVIDSGGKGNHSVFATALIAALKENNGMIDTSELFNRIRRPVVLHADQTPEYADIRKAGHEGGEFVFIREK